MWIRCEVYKTILYEIIQMKYTCKRCGYETNNRFDFMKHLNRKSICPPTNEDVTISSMLEELNEAYIEKTFKCQYCQSRFTMSKSKWRHEQTCKIKNDNDRIKALETEIKELRKQIDSKNDATTTINTNNGIINNININIDRRNFASGENTSYLESDVLLECFRDKDMITILNKLHFNPEHPENHNVRIKNMRHNLMEYVEEGIWKVANKDYVLHHMVFNGWRVLEEFHREKQDEVEDTCSDDEITESLLWLGRIYKEDPTLLRRIKNDAFILMMNNKALLLQKLPE